MLGIELGLIGKMINQIHQMTKTRLLDQLQKKEKEVNRLHNVIRKQNEELAHLRKVARSKECKCGHSQ
jgi:hypothetical protein